MFLYTECLFLPAGLCKYSLLSIEIGDRRYGGCVPACNHASRTGKNAFIDNFHAIDTNISNHFLAGLFLTRCTSK